MTSVFDVASYILEKCGSMPTFKLQKLVYYCQAWHMSWNKGEPLFKEDFEAWINGPVVRKLFEYHRGYFDIDCIPLQKKSLNRNQKENINNVLKYYKDKSVSWLIDKTHNEEPWIKARGNTLSDENSDSIILKNSIYNFYFNKNIEILSNNMEL